jgi:hypothetical protein
MPAGRADAAVLPAAAPRSASLRSASLPSAASKTAGEAEEIPLFFTLIPVLALLSNYDRGSCSFRSAFKHGFALMLDTPRD